MSIRELPRDMDAEAAVLGAVLLRSEKLDQLEGLAADDFYDPRNRKVFASMLRLSNASRPIDDVTLEDDLSQHGELDAIGGLAALARMALRVPTAQNAEYYAAIVRRHARTRRLMLGFSEIIDVGYNGGDPNELSAMAQAVLRTADRAAPDEVARAGELIRQRMAEYDAIAEAQARGEIAITGVPTGLDTLDAVLGGLQRGIVTVIAGRPGMGKSACALGITEEATSRGYGAHVFSLEDSRQAYTDRMIAGASRVPADQLRSARMSKEEMMRISIACGRLAQRKNWLYQKVSAIGAEDVVRKVRRHMDENGTKLVVVDYLQILRMPSKYESKHDGISQNMNILAEAAARDEIAYLVMAQLNREVERRQDKRPMLSDLRESGTIEERSKCVLGLYRGAYYGDPVAGIDYAKGDQPPDDAEWERRIEILVLKNSNGEAGTIIRRRWDGPTTRIY